MINKAKAVLVTLFDGDMKQLWQGMTWMSRPVDLRSQILPWLGRGNLALVLKVEALKIQLKDGSIEWLDSVDLDLCQASWSRIVASPDQLDWSYRIKPPQFT